MWINIVKKPVSEAKLNGVYFLYKENKVIYVGQSNNVTNNVVEHIGEFDFTDYGYIVVSDGEDLKNVEAFFIHKFKPVHNPELTPNTIGLTQEHLTGETTPPDDLVKKIYEQYGDIF